jgi:hypothetical protein
MNRQTRTPMARIPRQALLAGATAGLSLHQRRRDRALHRARRARHHEPRHLRHRRAVRSGQGLDATAPQAGWNKKIWYFSFGSSTGQPRRQSRTTVNWSDAGPSS